MPGVIIVLLALALCGAPAAAQDQDAIEIWLASTERCTSCAIFAEAARRRGYGDTLTYVHDGVPVAIPIKRVSKSSLSPAVAVQLIGTEGPRKPDWPLQLTVLVIRMGKVLYQGDIAESADPTTAPFTPRQMFPIEHPVPGDPALRDNVDHDQFFAEHWNLEHFVAIALGHAPPAPRVDHTWPFPAKLGPANVVLWGAAPTPLRNGLFTARRIKDIRALLELNDPPPRFITLFGHGPGNRYNDTSVMRDGVTAFMHAGVAADYAADLDGANAVLTALRTLDGARTLLVHVGHSGPTGIPLWGERATVSVEDVAAAGRNPASELVMISGGCQSGVFARAAHCGFFAAHPAIMASGCQLSEEAVATSDDYLRLFFERFTHGATGSDGLRTSLAGAHWHAATRIEDHQIAYTTVDALADEHFAAAPPPARMRVSEILLLEQHATAEESLALADLTDALGADEEIELTRLVERNRAAQRKLLRATNRSSAERNALLALPYKLQLPALARRLLYKSRAGADEQLRAATECEAQSITSFLAGE